jgi:heme exporter protein C
MIQTAVSFPQVRLRPWLGIVAVALSILAMWMGLVWAPTDAVQGDVYRIIYVHVPTAWLAYLAFVVVFLGSIGWLWTRRPWFDALAVASAEIGVLFTGLFIVAGSIWAKPTWGVWWDWDPRLTTTAVMVFAFGGILALRAFVDDPMKRAVWSAVACIVAFVDVPIVYFSVKWWNSLHQAQSTPETVSKAFHWPLRINAFGILFLWIGLVGLRTRVAELRLRAEIAPPLQAAPPRPTPPPAGVPSAGGAR